MTVLVFTKYTDKNIAPFDRVFDIFKELITHTSGDLDEAFDWLNELDREYNIFNDDYTLDDFKDDLRTTLGLSKKIKTNKEGETKGTGKGKDLLTAKLESALRQFALDQIFGKI